MKWLLFEFWFTLDPTMMPRIYSPSCQVDAQVVSIPLDQARQLVVLSLFGTTAPATDGVQCKPGSQTAHMDLDRGIMAPYVLRFRSTNI